MAKNSVAPLASYMQAPSQALKAPQDPRTPKWIAWEKQRQADIDANNELLATWASPRIANGTPNMPVNFVAPPQDAVAPAPANIVRGAPMANPPPPQYIPDLKNSTMSGGDQRYTPQMQGAVSDYLVGLSRKSARGQEYAKNADSVRAMIQRLGQTKDFSERRAIVETLRRTGFIGGGQ